RPSSTASRRLRAIACGRRRAFVRVATTPRRAGACGRARCAGGYGRGARALHGRAPLRLRLRSIAREHGLRCRAPTPSASRQPTRARLASCGLEELGRLRLLAAPDCDQHGVVQNRLVAGCLGDKTILVEEELSQRQLPRVNEASTEKVEPEAQLHERARLARDLYLARGQGMHG